MIGIDEFNKIRGTKHFVVLDTNILLELYRIPANISIDIIDVLKKIEENIYIPEQVYSEYLKNYQRICGGEKKKYQKVKTELSEATRNLQEDIGIKTDEYRKHNYTDISKLQSDLNEKISEIQNIIKDFESSHKAEIQFNTDFLKNDKVKEFVDMLMKNNRIGCKISFSERMNILKEGQVRYANLIPPGYRDSEKGGSEQYGDLFVWKSIIAISRKEESNILFICNDTKEDWWEKNKEKVVDLRRELLEEYKEQNPLQNIHFLTLEKFFGYISEELKTGKSKSALQLSALEDTKIMLEEYEENIYNKIGDYLCNIDIEEELEEDFLEAGEENIYWLISDASVEKEDRIIKYFVNIDISVLSDLIYQEDGDYPYDAGKLVLANPIFP